MTRAIALATACLILLAGAACDRYRGAEGGVAPVVVTATLSPAQQAAVAPASAVPAVVAPVAASVVATAGTPTPRATPSPAATPVARLVAEPASVAPGGCVVLRWTVSGARKVRLSGKVVPAQGSQEVCPDQDTTYYLWFEGRDGRAGEAKVAVQVLTAVAAAEATAVAADPERERDGGGSGKVVGPPTETECVGTECAVIEPPTSTPRPTRKPKPTEAPTDEPRATDPPATEEPTDEPKATEVPTDEPKPTEAPTDEPKPTDEPTRLPPRR